MKIGDVYFMATAHRGEDDKGPMRVRMDRYILRTVRGGSAFLVCQNDFTWVHKGKGVYGWADEIPSFCRIKVPSDEGVNPNVFARSYSGAIRIALRGSRKSAEYWSKNPGGPDMVEYDQHVASEARARVACYERWLSRNKVK